MPIIAAFVEANGWVLRLEMSGSLGNFGSYTLDPGGTPRITLASSHAGFIKSGGQAVAGNIARSLVGTKPLRKPANWNGTALDAAVIDETDLGGGSIRVRIALSEHVYATDTSLALSVLTGWRSGESGATGISVTNNSTAVAPIPILRWALLPYGVSTGAFTVALFVASHHPVGFEPVAGIRFTATDGTSVKTVWTTQLSTDTSYGDALRCYTATIDPATATALTAGLLRVDAEVYPWLGSMRSTDAAGTRSMATLRSDGFSVDAAAAWVIGHDPTGTRYNSQFAFVDPVNGTTTAAAGMVQSTLVAAKAVAAASRPKDINTALQAGYLANRTLAAANGQTLQTRSVDGMQIVLAAGTHAVGSTAVTTGLAMSEIPVRVIGDPADADPRNACVLPTSANGMSRCSRVHFQRVTLEIGVNSLISSCIVTMNTVTVRGRSGSESSGTAPFTAAPAAGQCNMALANTRWWKTAAAIGGGNTRLGLVRACEHSRQITSFGCAVKNRFMSGTEDGFVGSTVISAFSAWGSPTLAGQAEDLVLAWNDVRALRGRFFSFGILPAATAGTPNPSVRRSVIIGNVVERIGSDPQPLYSIGEDASATMSYNIIEANSFVGERTNTIYSDPLPTTIAETNTQLNQGFVNRVANNAFDWLPTKHDDFNDPSVSTLRASANGYRPQMIEAWSMLYGVGHDGNVDTRRATSAFPGLFPLEYSGARTSTGYSGALSPLYADDKSILGPSGAAATGGGSYRPAAASPLAGRGVRGNGDVDADGQTRRVPFASGAYQAVAVMLAPASARSAGRAGAAATAWTVGLSPAPTRHSLSGATAVGWTTGLAPSGSRHGLIGAAVLGWTVALAPAGGVLAQRARPAGLTPLATPASGRIGIADTGVPLAWLGALAPAATRIGQGALSPVVTVQTVMAPNNSVLPKRATAASLGIAIALLPGNSMAVLNNSAPALLPAMLDPLEPDRGWLSHRITMPLLLSADVRAVATIIVGPDRRTVFPNRN